MLATRLRRFRDNLSSSAVEVCAPNVAIASSRWHDRRQRV